MALPDLIFSGRRVGEGGGRRGWGWGLDPQLAPPLAHFIKQAQQNHKTRNPKKHKLLKAEIQKSRNPEIQKSRKVESLKTSNPEKPRSRKVEIQKTRNPEK